MIAGMIRLSIFVLSARMLLCFSPKEEYEKYLRLIVNLLVLVQFLLPIGEFLKKGNLSDILTETRAFQAEIEKTMEEMEWDKVLQGEGEVSEGRRIGEKGGTEIVIDPIQVSDVELSEIRVFGTEAPE